DRIAVTALLVHSADPMVILGVLPQYHHRIGRMYQERSHGYSIDVYLEFLGVESNTGLDTASAERYGRYFDVDTFFASAFEHGIIEQLQSSNLVAASTVKMLQIANTNGQAIFLANATNWNTGANIKGQLINYDPDSLSQFEDEILHYGYIFLLPQNGSNHISGSGSWAGW